jgi:hypothetical protein
MRYGLVLITLVCCSPVLAREHGGGMTIHSVGPERIMRIGPQTRMARTNMQQRVFTPVHLSRVNVQDGRRDILTGFPVRSTEVNDSQMILSGTPLMERRR